MKRNLALILTTTTFLAVSNICPIFAQTPSTQKLASPSAALSPTLKPTLVVDQEPTTGIHLTLSPIYLNITTDPNTEVKSEFKVTNNNNVKEFISLSLIKFRADASGANISPIDIDETDEFVKWITFSEDQFELQANETKKINFTINVPNNAALGYYYGIRVGRLKEKSPNSRETVITGSAILSLLMEVRSPNAKKELNILDFSTTAPVYEYLPAEFNVRVRNTGNIHVVPFGDIFIDQGEKKDVGVIHANAGRGNILPQSERVFTIPWAEGFPVRVPKMNGDKAVTDKNGKTEYTTKWDLTKITNFRIGKYTANLVMVYDTGKEDVPLNATVSFWVIPWKILLVAFAVLVLVLFGLRSIFTSIFRRNKNS